MRLSVPAALALALIANLIPGLNRTATVAEDDAASQSGGGKTPAATVGAETSTS